MTTLPQKSLLSLSSQRSEPSKLFFSLYNVISTVWMSGEKISNILSEAMNTRQSSEGL